MHLRKPKWLRLKRTQERRIEKLLNMVPHTGPEIAIRPYDGEPFEVEVRGASAYFVPLETGAEEVFADYWAYTRILDEAIHVRVARRVRISGVWCFETYGTGGRAHDGHVPVTWYHPWCSRIEREVIRNFYSDNTDELSRFPRRIGPSVDVRWTDDTVEGPDLGVVGHSVVEVCGRSFECIRVLRVLRFSEDSNPFLDDIHFTREGQLVLLRGYITKESALTEMEQPGDDCQNPISGPMDRIVWNGLEFVHWYDRLSGLALGINPRTT